MAGNALAGDGDLPGYNALQVGTYGMANAMPQGDLQQPLYTAGNRQPMGMIAPGNTNLNTRPSVWNPEGGGGYSTVYSMSFQDPTTGNHVLVPLVTDQGTIDKPEQAVERYKATGKHLGVFASSELADDYANRLHLQQEAAMSQNALAR